MNITLITPENHEKLLSIYNSTPALFLQNEGYQYIKKANLTEEDKAKIQEITAILKKSICGFSEFNNFRLTKKTQEIEIRIQYDWTAHDRSLGIPYTGVGYILLDELLNGFRN